MPILLNSITGIRIRQFGCPFVKLSIEVLVGVVVACAVLGVFGVFVFFALVY
jgi:hypothetical protein